MLLSHYQSIVFATLLAFPAGVATAATIYRWTDDDGRTHYGDVVPERYQHHAKPISPPATDPTSEQKRESLERAKKERNQAESIQKSREAVSPPVSPDQATTKSKRPPQAPTPDTDCETWQRLYRESVDCFGPYRTVRGATRPEAFDVCTPVDEPPPSRCRMYNR